MEQRDLTEGTAAAINSAIEQLNAGLGNASAAQGELGNIQAQSQVAVQAETNGSSVQEFLKPLRPPWKVQRAVFQKQHQRAPQL